MKVLAGLASNYKTEFLEHQTGYETDILNLLSQMMHIKRRLFMHKNVITVPVL